MKQLLAAPQMPAVAYARVRCAFGLSIAGNSEVQGFDFKAGGSTTATNLSTRRLGMRTT